MTIHEAVGARVREIRESLGLSARDFALRTNGGIHPSAIYGLEAGERNWSLEHVVAAARVLGVEPASLLPSVHEPGDDQRREQLLLQTFRISGPKQATLLLLSWLKE